MNTPVTIINEDDTRKPGCVYVGPCDDGTIHLAVENAEHMDEASVVMSPGDALQLGLKLIHLGYKAGY